MLLDLIKPQEGIFCAELPLKRVEEDLVLGNAWLTLPKRLVDTLEPTSAIRDKTLTHRLPIIDG